MNDTLIYKINREELENTNKNFHNEIEKINNKIAESMRKHDEKLQVFMRSGLAKTLMVIRI